LRLFAQALINRSATMPINAIPNVLAMQVAGLGASALFAGSWSEWCSDPQRPVAKG